MLDITLRTASDDHESAFMQLLEWDHYSTIQEKI